MIAPHSNASDTEDLLTSCLTNSISNGMFSSKAFFNCWFRSNGHAYFFLFKKNLQVTNIQLAELIALLRSYAASSDGKKLQSLQLITSEKFNESIDKITSSLFIDQKFDIPALVDSFRDLLESTIIVDSYFGSCVVFTPSTIKLELPQICAKSGYVHSCGNCLYIRNINKAVPEELNTAIDKFLAMNPENMKSRPVRFVVFDHEDFTKYDRKLASELRHGLDDVKIYIEKYYFGREHLSETISKIKATYKEQLHVLDAGDYVTTNADALEKSDPNRCLWLLVDRSLGSTARQKGDDQYFICYEQLYRNESPFHIFDENKPAWIDHTTIPHTLMGAMINLSRPWWPSSRVPIIGDPFVGTGTSWLEALRDDSLVVGSDLSLFADILCADNGMFFALKTVQLEELARGLDLISPDTFSTILVPNPNGSSSTQNRHTKALASAISLYNRIIPSSKGELNLTNQANEVLRDMSDMLSRVLFYVCLRTYRRHFIAFARASDDWAKAFMTEMEILREQLKNLIELSRRMDLSDSRKGNVCVFDGKYSQSCTWNRDNILSRLNNANCITANTDVGEFPANSCDVIVTDPPYGFNTSLDSGDLARLFKKTIDVVLRGLKPNGQLVIALPDWSHIGHEVPYFVVKDIFIPNLLIAAGKVGRQVVSDSLAMPAPGGLFRAPYYWESEKALRRAILHFRLIN